MAMTTPHTPQTPSARATTTPHVPSTPSARATTTPHAPPTPLRAKRCAEGQRAPPPPSHRLCGMRHPRTPVNPPPPAPTHAPLRVCWGHTERGEVQPERRTARGCTASAVSSHARKGRPHVNGGVYARGWCPPAFSQRREDVQAGQGATRARAARETEGAGTLSAPSCPVN
ncbi:hypothetical protein BJY52DRAFT_1277941 [Lactarius psammicola]|nr:hypothetical protein BJY52DRAFT_1277941 [Lactarius psammicola]